MDTTQQIQEAELQQFTQFKKQLSRQAVQAQVGKIEYNLADASADKNILKRACQEANALKLGAVCVLPDTVKICSSHLGQQRQTLLVACISFPHGGDVTKIKTAAIKTAVRDGADEVEVTVPVSYIKEANWGYVKKEFKKIKRAAKKTALRINIESALLTQEEIAKVCAVATECGITSLRTESGVYGRGFNADLLTKICSAVKDKCTVKADGITTVSDMITATSMGAGIIGSKNAADIARLLLQTSD